MKLKKLNNKGFVLAETLVVTVFLMVIFTMIYSYFYPLIGEYEKRENYDDIDSVYAIYWIKRIIEDSSYNIAGNSGKQQNFQDKGYFRVECSDITKDEEKRKTCIELVRALQVENCNSNGDECNIFVTKYRIGGNGVSFKKTVKYGYKIPAENCSDPVYSNCVIDFSNSCSNPAKLPDYEDVYEYCSKKMNEKIFRSGFVDYVVSLPDYSSQSPNGAKYRVIASFKHTKDNNNYYTYSTIEVSK